MSVRVLMILFVLVATPLLAGSVQVRDADTIVVSGTPVRLQGVDAP